MRAMHLAFLVVAVLGMSAAHATTLDVRFDITQEVTEFPPAAGPDPPPFQVTPVLLDPTGEIALEILSMSLVSVSPLPANTSVQATGTPQGLAWISMEQSLPNAVAGRVAGSHDCRVVLRSLRVLC